MAEVSCTHCGLQHGSGWTSTSPFQRCMSHHGRTVHVEVWMRLAICNPQCMNDWSVTRIALLQFELRRLPYNDTVCNRNRFGYNCITGTHSKQFRRTVWVEWVIFATVSLRSKLIAFLAKSKIDWLCSHNCKSYLIVIKTSDK